MEIKEIGFIIGMVIVGCLSCLTITVINKLREKLLKRLKRWIKKSSYIVFLCLR